MKPKEAPLVLIYRLPSNLSRRALYFYYHHRFPRVRDPISFTEKINWRILKDRREILTWTCDKLAMKDYASRVQGATDRGMRIPRTLWSGTDVRELENAELPDHWVLKPNNRSGLVFFGHDRPDIPALQKLAATWLRPEEAAHLHEWAYLKARPLLVAEEFLGTPGSPPPDYKFYVFAGKVAAIEFHTGRYNDHRIHYYTPDWTPLEVSIGTYPLESAEIIPPVNLENMVEIAGELGGSFDFIRVDLYSVDGEIFFGELTPYPGSGINPFVPKSFDDELGANWELPVL